MLQFSQLSVARKIRFMSVVTTSIALFLFSAIVITMEINTTRQALVAKTQTLANLTGTHVVAALIFDDPTTAEELLKSMAFEPEVLEAKIIQKNGEPFAAYRANPSDRAITVPEDHFGTFYGLSQSQYHFTYQVLHLDSPITMDRQIEGYIAITVSLEQLWHDIAIYIIGVLVISFGVLLLVFAMASKLNKRITTPIQNLLRGMKTISIEQSYSIRLPGSDNDELGAIIHGFNDMIEQIEKRNQEIQQKTAEVEQHAFYDALTSLPNRRLLTRQLHKECAKASQSFEIGALMYLDLDHFKIINDSLGHATGDDLLRQVSSRIRSTLQEKDTPARMGGDEFVIIIPSLNGELKTAANRARSLAEVIRHKISEPYHIHGRALHTSPSIGITLFHCRNCNVDEIIKQADLAMYRAKEDGRNLVQFFAQDMQRLAIQRLQVEEQLRYALEHDTSQLELFYQPQVTHDGTIFGAEALMRWHHPSSKHMGPDTFIPIAEITGLIHPLGKWTINQACRQLAKWQSLGFNIQVAVNVSPNEFLHANFINQVLEAIGLSGVDPSYLELEITEGVILNHIEDVVTVMKELKRYGIRFAIDDFGTGYSSLQYLSTLPIAKLKIDKSFVSNITKVPSDAAIVTTIIAMTKHLNLNVIAEGVETQEESNFLLQHGCGSYQGYFYGKPLSASEFEQQLLKQAQQYIEH